MYNFKFIKSFSKGQITIPKELRQLLGVKDEFWMKLSIDDGKLIAEPITQTTTPAEYKKSLLSIKGDWFSISDHQSIRQKIKQRLQHQDL